MSSVRRDEIERMAQLACIGVEDHSLSKLTEQIAQILDYFAQLASIEGDGQIGTGLDVTPHAACFREDVVSEPERTVHPATFAPMFVEQLFAVPRLRSMEDE